MRIASYTTTPRLSQDAFHSQLENAGAAPSLSASKPATPNPQTLTEKIVQRYSVGLAPGKKVKAGDYVTLKVGTAWRTRAQTTRLYTAEHSIKLILDSRTGP